MRGTLVRKAAALGALAVGAVACGDSAGPGAASVTVLLTDAASAYVESALVDIGAVELIGGAGGPIVLTDDGTDGPVDLMELQGLATTQLAAQDIEPGTYTQLRLVVESASVVLADGVTFRDGTSEADLTVPSGAQTGIKLNLKPDDENGGGVDIAAGQTVLVVDFDVNQSYRLQGNPDMEDGVTSVSFQPTLRALVDDVAGSISGTVTADAGVALDVEGLVVSAAPVENTALEPFESTTATALVQADGTYTIYFMVPGEYDVSVEAGEGFTAPVVEAVTVGQSEDVEGVDFVIVAG
ncbi:MAG: DUF4382 domain-containing protein [Gemmatimonadetes bacterium]|nr:DUF4382 domain-containing protein [Gemmatimonadota bacterium]